MIQATSASPGPVVIYPESDGQPMADNTRQYEWIVTIKGNLDIIFRDDVNVFVAGDLLWYPVEGDNKTRQAPDTMVVFGRPRGHRGSYRQWEEGGIAPQVVFEVLSPGNRAGKLISKFRFYERYAVEEYYIYDPDDPELTGFLRDETGLRQVETMHGWVSPRLGIRFDMSGPELVLFHPDGRPFTTFVELGRQVELAQRQADSERQAREQAHRDAESERQRSERLAAQLRALGAEPEA